MSKNKYDLRYVAQFVIEAKTPLNLSSGEKDALTDSLVMTDANGLPMIPGTSLCGVLRRAYADSTDTKQIIDDKDNPVSFIDKIFGYQGKKDDGRGSRLIVSNAHFLDNNANVIEGLKEVDWSDDFFAKFAELPIREHCKISHKGTTDVCEHGKFDNQVVYKGTRFKFEIELIGEKEEVENWNDLLSVLCDSTFRLGGGTRKGYGAIEVISAKCATFDLSDSKQLDAYLDKSAKLADGLVNADDIKTEIKLNDKWEKYELKLTPSDFYSFGSGFGDEDVDMTPVYENVIEWKNNIAEFANKKILIPASSVKGAISHRVAFYYNKLSKNYADKVDDITQYIGENNPAVCALFGYKKDSQSADKKKQEGQRGNVILSDVFISKNNKPEKILNHVAIDRFTGGARDGALFDEKVITQKDELILEFLVNKNAFKDDKVKEAFEKTLDDIKDGMLPLGGSTMRGHGSFNGTWKQVNKN